MSSSTENNDENMGEKKKDEEGEGSEALPDPALPSNAAATGAPEAETTENKPPTAPVVEVQDARSLLSSALDEIKTRIVDMEERYNQRLTFLENDSRAVAQFIQKLPQDMNNAFQQFFNSVVAPAIAGAQAQGGSQQNYQIPRGSGGDLGITQAGAPPQQQQQLMQQQQSARGGQLFGLDQSMIKSIIDFARTIFGNQAATADPFTAQVKELMSQITMTNMRNALNLATFANRKIAADMAKVAGMPSYAADALSVASEPQHLEIAHAPAPPRTK